MKRENGTFTGPRLFRMYLTRKDDRRGEAIMGRGENWGEVFGAGAQGAFHTRVRTYDVVVGAVSRQGQRHGKQDKHQATDDPPASPRHHASGRWERPSEDHRPIFLVAIAIVGSGIPYAMSSSSGQPLAPMRGRKRAGGTQGQPLPSRR